MRVEGAKVEKYHAYLKDKYRSPSQGGNTRAWHLHVITIEGLTYSYLALGALKWIYKTDIVDFEWQWDETRRYRNIDPNSVVTRDAAGTVVVRGHRGTKRWRTAGARMPASRREQR